jgi:hypothetical protein
MKAHAALGCAAVLAVIATSLAVARRWRDLRPRIEGLQRMIAFLPVTLHAVEWDYAGLLRLIAAWCERAAAHHEAHRLVADWQRTARELRIAAKLCRRVLHPPYLTTLGYDSTYAFRREPRRVRLRNAGIARLAAAQEEADLESLARLFRRKLRSWWD